MLQPFIEAVEGRRKQFTVYGSPESYDLADQLTTRNVTVEYRELPTNGPEPFVTIHDDGFVGAISLEDLETLLAPPVVRPGHREGVDEGYRALFDVLSETLFSSLDRRQLLATSREIEDRALRVGAGTLRASFQSFSRFEPQTGVYRRLGGAGLDVHVYGDPDWTPPDIENVTYHADSEGNLERFWALAFDGGPGESQACALVVEERADGYHGFWTYDHALTGEVLATLESAAD